MKKYIFSILFLFVFISFVQAQAVAYQFSNNLSIGNSGSDVAKLQTFLDQAGFLAMPVGVAKGYFGEMTKQALIKYQQSVGISPTGFFGPITRAQISKVPPYPITRECATGYGLKYDSKIGDWHCVENKN